MSKNNIVRQVCIYVIQSLLCVMCMLFAHEENLRPQLNIAGQEQEIRGQEDLQECEKPIITIIGTGYVGLVSGAGLAEFGNTVICADVDARKIEILQNGGIPIYEPGLKELVEKNVQAGRLTFTSDVDRAVQDARILFIAVGTPMSDEGDADMKYVFSVVNTIARNINDHKIIVTKSTVPVGTGRKIRDMLQNEYNIDGSMFSMISNPEFLREGSAIVDFLSPDRVVIGGEDDLSLNQMCQVYKYLIQKNVPIVLTNIQTAEAIKYASNAFLAVKLSFINELANLCDEVSADIKTLSQAMGLDSRIGSKFLNPGPGYGGSCFPKDTQALVFIAKQYGVLMNIVRAAIEVNEYQKTIALKKLKKLFLAHSASENLAGKKIAVLGLAFKAETDDIRYSSSITLIEGLLAEGAIVHTYDPVAMENMKEIFPVAAGGSGVIYCNNAQEAINGADAVVIMTEWNEFKQLDIEDMAPRVNNKILLDMRNIFNPLLLKKYGFICDAIGQSHLCKQNSHRNIFIPKKRAYNFALEAFDAVV